MQIIDLDIEVVKTNYKKDRKIIINNEIFKIGFICGAIEEFILFNKGKKYIVFNDEKQKICFVIL